MKKSYLLLVFITIGLGSLTAQSFVGKLNPNPTKNYKSITANDTLKILAVMSDFQKDIDDATFGDGKFGSIYSQDYGTEILDPLPHDKAYFENHLQFVQNYFRKVSNGKLNISFTILDDILTVSKTMRNYTPPLEDLNDLAPVGTYAEEVWSLADSHYPDFDFSQYDLFVILHAGVGKDVSLPGSLGNERDLPSVYLNEKSLKDIFGEEFTGFPVNNGNFKIPNSALLPETESRELEGFDGISLIELTTNGLLAATIGSHLGLPDLYNTETGRSAIGRFGLMDGQSMFTYQGIYPPEPSAWEKMFLGWVEPTEVSIGSKKLNLVNQHVANIGDTTLIKIPINGTEYYLIENRKRDAYKNGSTVTYVSNGKMYSKSFSRDYENYIYYNVDTLEGVIVDVDEFDWALPGGDRNSKIENFEDLGLIIWHIDERIIDENYESNTINNDRYTRGVALVEADGIRDIGEEFNTIFGEVVIGEGTKEDTWYANNPAEFYENKFSYDTNPKAESNTKTNSLVTLADFSEIANTMSFNISFGSENVNPISYKQIYVAPDDEVRWLSSLYNGEKTVVYYTTNGSIKKIDLDGEDRFAYNIMTKYKPLIIGQNGAEIIIATDSNVLVLCYVEKDNPFITDTRLTNEQYSSSPVLLSQSDSEIEFIIGTDKGVIIKYLFNLDTKTFTISESKQIFQSRVTQIALLENGYNAISQNYYWSSNFANNTPITLDDTALQLVNTNNGTDDIAIIQTNSELIKISNLNEVSIIKETESVIPFAVADLKSDGNNYIIRNNNYNLEAINYSDIEADNFPYQDEFGAAFYSSPLSVDLNNDDIADIVSFLDDGKIVALDGVTGKMIDGFPISSGAMVKTIPTIFTKDGRTSLGIITGDNIFISWNISKYDGKKFWTEENGSASNTSIVIAPTSINQTKEFFPQSKAYNWPNPVYDGVTNIRYFVSEDSKAEVTIFDLAGDLVAKLSGDGVGGLDNEIVWNVNDIQSGIYFAHLKVTGTSGKSDTKIIKIAIIK